MVIYLHLHFCSCFVSKGLPVIEVNKNMFQIYFVGSLHQLQMFEEQAHEQLKSMQEEDKEKDELQKLKNKINKLKSKKKKLQSLLNKTVNFLSKR